MNTQEKLKKTSALTSKQKIDIVKRLESTILSHRQFSMKEDISIGAIYKWRSKIADGDIWGLMSQDEMDQCILSLADNHKCIKIVIAEMRKKGCRSTTNFIKHKMRSLGIDVKKESSPTTEVRKQRRAHVIRLFKKGDWKSYQSIAEIVGCSVTLVSNIAVENGIDPKTKAGKKRYDEFEDFERVKIKKPKMNPLIAQFLGMRI